MWLQQHISFNWNFQNNKYQFTPTDGLTIQEYNFTLPGITHLLSKIVSADNLLQQPFTQYVVNMKCKATVVPPGELFSSSSKHVVHK